MIYEDTRRASAGRRLERTLETLRGEKASRRSGHVVEADPVAALKDALAQLEPRPDEIIVSTHPRQRSGWLRRNVVERVQKAAGEIPVEHIEVDLDEEREKVRRVLVVANQTPRRRSAPRQDPRAGRARAVVVPDPLPAERSDRCGAPGGGAAAEARAHDPPRRGPRRPWADRAPRPVHGRPHRRRRTSASTRSSSRRSRARPLESGSGATSSIACARRPALPVDHIEDRGRAPRRLKYERARRGSARVTHPSLEPGSRVDARTLGMFLFIASEIMLFGSFFTAYFFVRVDGGHAVADSAPTAAGLRRRG